MRNPIHVVLIAVTAFAVAGCGSADDKDIQRAANAALDPQGVVDQYRAAVIEGDGDSACSLLSDKARADTEQDGSDCSARLEVHAEQSTPDDVAAEKAMRPRAVVSGTKAVAKFKTLGGDPTQIVLEKQGGAWKVADSPELVNIRTSNRYG